MYIFHIEKINNPKINKIYLAIIIRIVMEQEQDVFMKEFKRFRQLDIQSDEFKNSILSSHEPNLSYFRKQVRIILVKNLFSF